MCPPLEPSSVPHVPVLRFGTEYESLDVNTVSGYADGEPRAQVSQANAGMLRRDLRRVADRARALRKLSTDEVLERAAEAAQLFLEADLTVGGDVVHGPEDYVRELSATSGLPHTLARGNMQKVAHVLANLKEILRGLTRGLPTSVLDELVGATGDGLEVSFASSANVLGVVLPSNSPGVNGLWIPSLALRTPVVLKPGRDEPWTPLRVVRALVAAGLPAEAFGFYPTDHEGARTLLELADRSLLFGDAATTKPYQTDPRVEVHGPGNSKLLFGPDEAPRWEEHLDVLFESVAANGGRSCVNASAIYTTSHADELADALARRLAEVTPRAPDDPEAGLCAFAAPRVAAAIDGAIQKGLEAGGEDVTARYRDGERYQQAFGGHYLAPTLVRTDGPAHPLADVEYLFPFVSVVEVPAAELLGAAGRCLVATAITRDPGLQRALLASPDIGRLNLGPVPTPAVRWDQPHEGNLFDFLFSRRAIARAEGW